MSDKQFEEHFCKEVLKQTVERNNRYSNEVKDELKMLIDSSRSAQELFVAILCYFAEKGGNLV